MPTPYCLPEDVNRKLDLPVDSLTADDRERLRARIDAVSQQWDQTTGSPMRQVRVGTPDKPRTYEHHDARSIRGPPPVIINLDHGNISPIDAAAGDVIEVRTGRDSWEDVTADEGDAYVLDYDRGQLKVYRFLINRGFWERPEERFLRLSYRHGALGGDRNRGGQTALDGSVTDTDTTIAVDDVGTLPASPGLLTVGTVPDIEYVRVTGVDGGTDTLSVTRGARRSSPSAHPDDAPVQYVPTDVREAVAAKVAEQVVMFDETQLSITDDGQLSSRDAKAEDFAAEWQQACATYSGVRML